MYLLNVHYYNKIFVNEFHPDFISTVESLIYEIAKYAISVMKSKNSKWNNHLNLLSIPPELSGLESKEGFFNTPLKLKDIKNLHNLNAKQNTNKDTPYIICM